MSLAHFTAHFILVSLFLMAEFLPAQLQVSAPQSLKLVQWQEGEVTIRGSLPTGASHFRIYLSQQMGNIGTLTETITPIEYPDGPATFAATPGVKYYVTVRGYNALQNAESTNTDQYLVQMYQALTTGYWLSSFFHEPPTGGGPQVTWAIGKSKTLDLVSVLRSTNYFTTWTVDASWSSASLGNTPSEYLTFYMDKFGHKYVSARPTPLICRNGTSTWAPMTSVAFMNPNEHLLVPGWSISEDDNNLIVFAEYGDYGVEPSIKPHRRILKSTDPLRVAWGYQDFPGRYKHIHFYQINPYNTQVHMVGLGDPLDTGDPTPVGLPYGVGLYISTDGGQTWGQNLLDAPGLDGDGFLYNAPTTATFFPPQRAFVTNDTHGARGYWWGFGKNDWSNVDLRLNLNLDVFPVLSNYLFRPSGTEVGWPVTPWSAMAIAGSGEIYGCANSSNDTFGFAPPTGPRIVAVSNAPMVLFRYDHDAVTDTGKVTEIAAGRNYTRPFRYMSTSRGNIIPAGAQYVFNDALGGIRIPR